MSLGSIADRLTIDGRKALEHRLRGPGESDHVSKLQRTCAGYAAGIRSALQSLEDPDQRTAAITHFAALAAVNASLWQAEDDLRRLRKINRYDPAIIAEAGRIAFKVQELNDTRADLVFLLNQLLDKDSLHEKVRPR